MDFDPVVIGGHNNLGNSCCFCGLFCNALQHGFPGNMHQWLPRKTTARVTGGYDDMNGNHGAKKRKRPLDATLFVI
jgi:hypothetical protein